MSDQIHVRRALISVSDKTDLIPFARTLVERFNVEIISTGGTARTLTDAGIRVVPVDEVTGSPEMMDGRVKTLHPSIHGALLARRDRPAHTEALTAHGITPIDLLVINLYPFEATVSRSETTTEEAIEQIDIGGPAMIRSGAKNHDFTCVVTDASQYDRLITELTANGGRTTQALRRAFAEAAFLRTAAYDVAIAGWMQEGRDRPFPELLRLSLPLSSGLRYGENPHQRAAIYADPGWRGTSVINARTIAGKPLSYNNLADAAAALNLVEDLGRTFPGYGGAAIIKHTNPCGAAIGTELLSAIDDAHRGDPVAAYGGVLAVNRAIDGRVAEGIIGDERFLEVIIAPDIDDDAAQRLTARWKNVRLLAVGTPPTVRPPERTMRSIPGGMLVQDADHAATTAEQWTLAAGEPLAPNDLRTALLAWTLVRHVTSNAIVIAARDRMIGAGGGQVDRVGACTIAIRKAERHLADTNAFPVAASDAFFPFSDGPRALIESGVRAIIQPGGSMRDEETIALCREHNVTCYMTGVRHFRH